MPRLTSGAFDFLIGLHLTAAHVSKTREAWGTRQEGASGRDTLSCCRTVPLKPKEEGLNGPAGGARSYYRLSLPETGQTFGAPFLCRRCAPFRCPSFGLGLS